MKSRVFLALIVSLAVLTACSKTPQQERQAKAPLVIPSKQMQQDFFACKDLIGNEWVGIGENFSTDDGKIIVIARLDPSELNSWLTIELVSPDDQIIEKESLEYEAVRDIGIEFDPVKLADKGGAGRYQANVYSDTRPMGRVEFFLEDRREEGPLVEGTDNPELSGIHWDTPSQ
jgi:hypothetical protein